MKIEGVLNSDLRVAKYKKFRLVKKYIMLKFTLAEDSLPFSYFEELDFSFEDLAIMCINKKFPQLSYEECENVFEENSDLFTDEMYELKDSDVINDYCVGEEEVDEGSGTWGYYHFEIDDIDKVKSELEVEVLRLFDEIVENLDL
jgi:hypothetical protein